MRFNPPPGWPPPPEGFTPDPGWQPDPTWPPAPPGWQLWVPDELGGDASGGPTPGYLGYQQVPSPAGYAGTAIAPADGSQPPFWGPSVPQSSGTSGLAIAGFILGLLGFTGITAILGIVLGSVALSRIRRTLQPGRGLAIAGIVLGSAWLALYAVGIVIAVVASGANPGSSASPPAPVASATGSQVVDAFTLTTGDCFDNPQPTSVRIQHVSLVVQTPCTQPHNAQIFARFTVSGSVVSYPGDAKMFSIADSGCTARAPASLDPARVTSSMSIRFLFPLESRWLDGGRTISCIAYSPTPTLRSSVLKG